MVVDIISIPALRLGLLDFVEQECRGLFLAGYYRDFVVDVNLFARLGLSRGANVGIN